MKRGGGAKRSCINDSDVKECVQFVECNRRLYIKNPNGKGYEIVTIDRPFSYPRKAIVGKSNEYGLSHSGSARGSLLLPTGVTLDYRQGMLGLTEKAD